MAVDSPNKKPGRRKEETGEQITIVQWNQKDLTFTGTELSKERIKKVATTIKSISKASVIAMEEVVSGIGGVKAVQQIVNQLNEDAKQDWKYELSAVVNPNSPRKKEHYAVIWRKSHMGEDVVCRRIMPNGFEPVRPDDDEADINTGNADNNTNGYINALSNYINNQLFHLFLPRLCQR